MSDKQSDNELYGETGQGQEIDHSLDEKIQRTDALKVGGPIHRVNAGMLMMLQFADRILPELEAGRDSEDPPLFHVTIDWDKEANEWIVTTPFGMAKLPLNGNVAYEIKQYLIEERSTALVEQVIANRHFSLPVAHLGTWMLDAWPVSPDYVFEGTRNNEMMLLYGADGTKALSQAFQEAMDACKELGGDIQLVARSANKVRA